MAQYKWTRDRDTDASIDTTSAEWTEHWTVHGVPVDVDAAWGALLADRPDLRPGQPHPKVLGCSVDNFDCDSLGTTNHAYSVAVGYRGEIRQEDDEPVSLLDQQPRIRMAGEDVEKPVTVDRDGNPIINTAGDLIAGITEYDSVFVFPVSQYVTSLPQWILGYNNATNSDAVRILGLSFQPGFLLFKKPQLGDEQTQQVGRQKITYREFSYELHYHRDGWVKPILNRGLNELYLDKSGPVEAPKPGQTPAEHGELKKRRIRDAEGNPVEEPQFLNRQGGLAGTLETEGETTLRKVRPEDIVTLKYWTKHARPFRVLGLR